MARTGPSRRRNYRRRYACRLRVVRYVVLAALLVGCGIDESGLLDEHEAASDVGPVEAAGNDVTQSDAADASPIDVVVVDAPPDVIAFDAPQEAASDAGPILTITGGSYTLLALDAGACSVSSNQAASFQIVNDRSASIDLYWVDFTCAEKSYGTIQSNGQASLGSYVTHVWRVRNTSDQAFLASFVLNSPNAYTIDVNP